MRVSNQFDEGLKMVIGKRLERCRERGREWKETYLSKKRRRSASFIEQEQGKDDGVRKKSEKCKSSSGAHRRENRRTAPKRNVSTIT